MKLLRDECGQAAMMMASFLALVALGFMALAIDAGYFFREKRMAQSAADAAAIAAAEELSSNNRANMQSAASAMAKMNGFDNTLATNPAVVTVNNPPSYGNYVLNQGYVEVIVTKPVPTLLLGAFNHSITSMGVAGRAVAGLYLPGRPIWYGSEHEQQRATRRHQLRNYGGLQQQQCGGRRGKRRHKRVIHWHGFDELG
jgi:uncharacterized membrane protein